ncbi:MFS transporter [Paraburkholderia aromaticivorans]|uniref:MFS transporter n=1 Tax=Paraburkholderia aromaticivorans TaxID=2026199 RepID=UPI0038BD64C4
MSAHPVARPLPWRMFCPLLLAMFAIAVGYGFLLPILPRMLERIVPTADPAALSRHTGLLTGTYALALFLFAPLWGRFADRRGRRPAILLGLVGFAATLALFALVSSLPLLYLERALGGLFASSIAPAVYALVGDHAPSKEWRAHRFALLNIAGATGFLVGPMLGSLTMHVARNFLPRLGETSAYWPPFLVASGLAFAVALAVWAFVPSANGRTGDPHVSDGSPDGHATLLRLLVISFVTAAAVGTFEVGISLRGTQVLGMNTAEIGLMFTECSLVMLTVQSLVFSPLVKPEATRWLLTPALPSSQRVWRSCRLPLAALPWQLPWRLLRAAPGSFPPSPLTGSRSAPVNGKEPRWAGRLPLQVLASPWAQRAEECCSALPSYPTRPSR